MSKQSAKKPRKLTGEVFDALPDAEKERIYDELDRMTPAQMRKRFKPMTRKERAEHLRPKRVGRPKLGQGVKVISLSLERDLLKRADAYAKANGMKRSEMVTTGLELVMDRPTDK